MTRWSGIVLAHPHAGSDEMESRLPVYLHPVAGRSVIWHAVAALFAVDPSPQRVLVVADTELPPDFFQDAGGETIIVAPVPDGDLPRVEAELPLAPGEQVLIISASAVVAPEELTALVGQEEPLWLGGHQGETIAASIPSSSLGQLLRLPRPLEIPNGVLADRQRLPSPSTGAVVRDRAGLAEATALVRDRLVRQLMGAGVTFLLPDSVVLDVGVRIGRDSVIYPGVILEGQTTVGEETVIGPGCRVISSWIGSGVEMKGWNYIAHTSIRNRAILEPYVRRGFD